MDPADLAALVRKTTVEVSTSYDVDISIMPENPTVERPRNPEHDNYITNVATQLGKRASMMPRDLATEITTALGASEGVDEAIIASPGFINIRLVSDAQGKIIEEVLAAGERRGYTDFNSDLDANLEFVSTDPAGPIHPGGTRWTAVGDTLGRVPPAVGAKVTRGYYFNDYGRQIDRFSDSLVAAVRNQPTPEDGYDGEYIQGITAAMPKKNPQAPEGSEEKVREHFRAIDVDMIFEHIKGFLYKFGTDFNIYFHENSLFGSGQVEVAVNSLKENGKLYEADGVRWLKSTDYGDDRDRVAIRSDGDTAYIMGDVAYVEDKSGRGHSLCVYMLGTDHHGHTARLRAAAVMLSRNADGAGVLIGQMVNLLRDNKAAWMPRCAGAVVTLGDLVGSTSVDAARYPLIRSSADSSPDIDLGLWASQSGDNPVYRIQYGYTRLYSIDRRTEETGITNGGVDFSLLVKNHEGEFIHTIGEFLAIIKSAADLREPHHITRYTEQLIGVFYYFHDIRQILPKTDGEVSELYRARLGPVEATRQTLANVLQLLGVTAPECT